MATAKKRRPAKRPTARRPKRKGKSSGGGGGWSRSPITGVIALGIIAYCLYSFFLKMTVTSVDTEQIMFVTDCRMSERLIISRECST